MGERYVASVEAINHPFDNFSFSCPRVIGRQAGRRGYVRVAGRMTTGGGGERSPIPTQPGINNDYGLTFTRIFV